MYISSYIDNYEVSNKDSSGRVSVRATCYRSMRKSEKPHDLRIVFEDCSPVDISVAECSCVAGRALCNHNVALLFQTAHDSTLNLAAVPPVLSCTDTEQLWHKPRTMGVKPGRVSDMVCDFVVFAEEDILIQRIYRDCEVAKTIREKGDYFYFYM